VRCEESGGGFGWGLGRWGGVGRGLTKWSSVAKTKRQMARSSCRLTDTDKMAHQQRNRLNACTSGSILVQQYEVSK